jgi:hypothetical protein
MMPRATLAGVAMLSIGCAAEAYTTSISEPVCGWGVAVTASFDDDAGECEWSIASHDTDVARLRSIDGVQSSPAPLCEIDTFARIDALRPRDLVEIWAPGDVDAETAWLATELSGCH